MLSCDVNEITEVKADPDQYSRNSDETRHWVVCQGGVLQQVKAEYTLGVSLWPAEDGKKQLNCSKSHAKMEYGSQLKVDGQNPRIGKPFSSDTSGKSIVNLINVLIVQSMARIYVKPYTCDNCGKSFAQSSTLTKHEKTHSAVKPYNCETCRKSFALSGTLNQHETTHPGVKPYTVTPVENHSPNTVH